jgi:hypothetical protein
VNPFGTQLYSELTTHSLSAIESCVGPIDSSEDRYNCLMGSLEQLLSLKSQSGSFTLVRDALARAETLRNGTYIYGRLPQETCDLVGAGDSDGDPFSEDCGSVAVDRLPSRAEACFASLNQPRVDSCIAAVRGGEQCSLSERVKPVSCRMPTACQELIELAIGVSSITATPAVTAPPIIVSGTLDEQLVIGTWNGAPALSRHSASTHLCMPTEVGGRIHSEHNNFGGVRTHIDPATGRWAFSVQTTGENADRTRALFQCIAKAEFGPRAWGFSEGGNPDWSVQPVTTNPVIIGGFTPPFHYFSKDFSNSVPGTGHTNFLHALTGFSGAFHHPSMRVNTISSDLSPARWEARAFGFNLINLTTLAITASPFFVGHFNTLWVQTAGVTSPVSTIDTGLRFDNGFCYLNGVGGEFAWSTDRVTLRPRWNAEDTALTWQLSVTAGRNLGNVRDLWGRAQCIRFR